VQVPPARAKVWVWAEELVSAPEVLVWVWAEELVRTRAEEPVPVPKRGRMKMSLVGTPP